MDRGNGVAKPGIVIPRKTGRTSVLNSFIYKSLTEDLSQFNGLLRWRRIPPVRGWLSTQKANCKVILLANMCRSRSSTPLDCEEDASNETRL